METRKRARLTGHDCVAFLHYVVRSDKIRQRREACTFCEHAVESGRVSFVRKQGDRVFHADEICERRDVALAQRRGVSQESPRLAA